MWILCQKCNDVRLVEQEKKEASERNNLDQGRKKKSCQRSSRGSGRNGADCCPKHEVDICSLELDKSFRWIMKSTLKNWKKLH